MEVREKYIARLISEPETHGVSEIKFIHAPQVAVSRWVRLRCQYICSHKRQSDVVPPFSPTSDDCEEILEEYRFGLMVRRAIAMPLSTSHHALWADFEQVMVDMENEAFVRGYGKAFAAAVGNCLFCHHDDSMRPCDYVGKSRPTLEAIGVNVRDTMDMIGWEQYLVSDPENDFQMFGLILLE